MPTFLDLYATRLDYELGTNDSNVLFTTARRKNSLNEGLREFADLTECWTRESTIATSSGRTTMTASTQTPDFAFRHYVTGLQDITIASSLCGPSMGIPFTIYGSNLEILYRDDDLVIVNKPSGLLVHRGWDNDDVVMMTLVRDALGLYVHPIHRLDRGASGALVFALSAGAAAALCAAFERGEVEKRYLALVRGIPPERGVIDYAIPGKPGGARVPAVTEIHRVAVYGRYSLVEAVPRTGRLHQIRRHLKHISCPLIGDVNYGKGEHNRLLRERYDLHRLALHAFSPTVPHPADRSQALADSRARPPPPDPARPPSATASPP